MASRLKLLRTQKKENELSLVGKEFIGVKEMDKRAKIMIIVAIFLFAILLVKSLWIDPVGALEGELLDFKMLAEEHAPIKHNNLLYRTGLITYRVTRVEWISEEEPSNSCVTCDSCVDSNGENRWKARVRAYFVYIIPFRDITVKESDTICNQQ